MVFQRLSLNLFCLLFGLDLPFNNEPRFFHSFHYPGYSIRLDIPFFHILISHDARRIINHKYVKEIKLIVKGKWQQNFLLSHLRQRLQNNI